LYGFFYSVLERKAVMRLVLCTSALFLCACEFQHEGVTPLVARVQTAGAGPLVNVSGQAMHLWFANHPNITASVARECNGIRGAAPASWAESTEGRMCQAASEANFFAPVGIAIPNRWTIDPASGAAVPHYADPKVEASEQKARADRIARDRAVLGKGFSLAGN
jgi:hypothetical protein